MRRARRGARRSRQGVPASSFGSGGALSRGEAPQAIAPGPAAPERSAREQDEADRHQAEGREFPDGGRKGCGIVEADRGLMEFSRRRVLRRPEEPRVARDPAAGIERERVVWSRN